MDGLYEKLVRYGSGDFYPMHMPGHKRNTGILSMINPYTIDITEIEGFDNLHQAEGILKQLSIRLQKLYQAQKSYPLINGSTAGILAGISSACNRGDRILMARNCHKSVYHAVILRELNPVYLYPRQTEELPFCCGISPEDVKQMLIKYPDIRLVVITSPTYEGVVSDIRTISELCHSYGTVLLVDEAHGAHFGFHEGFPLSAVTQGSDLVIQSLHKTLPAFTQTAVLHSNRPDLNKKIERFLSFYQSSSPSYLLMAGLDRCVGLLEEQGKQLFEAYYDRLMDFYEAMKRLTRLRLFTRGMMSDAGIHDRDPSKLSILTIHSDLTGHSLNRTLREEFHIEMEMEAGNYVLGMTSICDTPEGFERLKNALLQIDGRMSEQDIHSTKSSMEILRLKQVMAPYRAAEQKSETVKLTKSCQRIAAGFISLFPPGIPLLVPGEIIEPEILSVIGKAIETGLKVLGLTGENKDSIDVLA